MRLVFGPAGFADEQGLGRVLFSEAEILDSEVVLIFDEEVPKLGPRDIGELQFHFGGGDGSLAGWSDILILGAVSLFVR
jgi:hypothetical protein